MFLTILTLLSGIAFVGYALSFYLFPQMRVEFEKLDIDKYSRLVTFFELLGGLGMITGLFYHPILIISSLGLTVMMILALLMRIYYMNHFKFMIQSLIFALINGYIFYHSIC